MEKAKNIKKDLTDNEMKEVTGGDCPDLIGYTEYDLYYFRDDGACGIMCRINKNNNTCADSCTMLGCDYSNCKYGFHF